MALRASGWHDAAMRRIALPLLWLSLAAASPATDEILSLMDRGEEASAFALAEQAAGRGDVDAIDYLAWFYDEGRFVPQDHSRAAALYRRAAEGGQRHAQWRLGVMLDLGEGVVEDPEQAFRWIRLAAERGSPNALVSLAVMYANGRGVAVDYARAMEHYRAAARLGVAHGFFGIAALYNNGQGVPRDRAESLAWMFCAATLGDEEARRAAEQYGLDSATTTAAAERANAIFREFGLSGYEVRFRDLDAERAVPVS